MLRFDPTGEEDELPDLLAEARHRPLTDEEARLLAEALRQRQPWLEWSGKQEADGFEVDPVALHIHERVAAKAIVAAAARKEIQRSLFADPELEYRERVQFYEHEVDWANRLILGDSLQVMSSLAEREGLAGRVQMIYVDPPYGINYRSNWQPRIGQREVKDRSADLTREAEVVKGYRDTWNLGIHSYLAYLRDRLSIARQLLHDSGSIFVQISDDNVHRVRSVLDEIFGSENFCALIAFSKTSGQTKKLVPVVADFLLWYAKNKDAVFYRPLYIAKTVGGEGASEYFNLELPSGETRRLTKDEESDPETIPDGARIFATDSIVSDGFSGANSANIRFDSNAKSLTLSCGPRRHWKVGVEGTQRVWQAGRLVQREGLRIYKRYFDDFPFMPVDSVWTDTRGEPNMDYVVQTSSKVIERCILMTTLPGQLVLDPTCGGGTTAYAAERWGRRWITIDTSRVALSITRHRLLTSTFDFFELEDAERGPAAGFRYNQAPHIKLGDIAGSSAIAGVIAEYAPVLERRLHELNEALSTVPKETRLILAGKLKAKQKEHGKKAVSEADRRRWVLPEESWAEWEVPFDPDSLWPEPLHEALNAYRAAWRAKMDEINATIAAAAEKEPLVDQPHIVNGIVRVSGPFTVESVLPAEETLDNTPSPIEEFDEELETFGANGHTTNGKIDIAADPQNADAFIEQMIGLLRADGARFLGNKTVPIDRLEPIAASLLHAEGTWRPDGETERAVAVSFGPQVGNVSARQVEQCLRLANRKGYDDLLFVGLGFDDAAQAIIQDDPNPDVRSHLLLIRPDVMMGDLLKTTANSQIFTVLALPRTRLDELPGSEWRVTMEGMDVYDPVENTTLPTGADKVAAWFLDTDYDGRTFCICQAFFPDKSAWEDLAKRLKGVLDEEAFAAFSGDTSLPFRAGQHERVCVKVIDPRGNEATRVHALTDAAVYVGVAREQ